MIMRIPSFENDIVFSENYISVLHIQNGTLFARIIGSINKMCIRDRDRTLTSEEQAKVDAMAKAITDAINGLVKKQPVVEPDRCV